MVDLSIEIIIFEILTRVSPKAVGRSKTVCKDWYALLSGHDFVRVHCSRSLIASNQKALLIDNVTCSIHPINFQSNDYGPGTIIPCPFDPQFTNVSILTHLNGLLCVRLDDTSELLLWNPTTTAFKRLSIPYSRGFYKDNYDAVGLYIDAHDDYKVLHIERRDCGLGVYAYSRRADSWRNISFITRPEYLSFQFSWSPGTLCGDTLYFTVSDCWVGGTCVVICFDVNSEEFKEMRFPPVPNDGLLQAVLVNVKNKLHMYASTGLRPSSKDMSHMTIDLWMLEGESWIKLFSCPPISLNLWCSITHYVTNGNWFVMRNSQKIFDIEMDLEPFDRLYPVTWFRGFKGAVFTETIVSPSI